MKQIFHCSKQDSCDLVFLFNSSFICAWNFALIDYHTVGLYRYVRNYKYLLTFLIPHIVENFDFFNFIFLLNIKYFKIKSSVFAPILYVPLFNFLSILRAILNFKHCLFCRIFWFTVKHSTKQFFLFFI